MIVSLDRIQLRPMPQIVKPNRPGFQSGPITIKSGMIALVVLKKMLAARADAAEEEMSAQ